MSNINILHHMHCLSTQVKKVESHFVWDYDMVICSMDYIVLFCSVALTLVLLPCWVSLEVSQKGNDNKLKAKAIKVSMGFSLESCFQMDAKDWEPTSRIVWWSITFEPLEV